MRVFPNAHIAFTAETTMIDTARLCLKPLSMDDLDIIYNQSCKYIKDGIASWEDEMVYAILKNER